MGEERYGRVKFATIQATKNELRQAIQSEGTERIQALWDRLEQWLDSPPMQAQPTPPISPEQAQFNAVRYHERFGPLDEHGNPLDPRRRG